ncbi:hypothetical protein [Actinomadura gamaensis]|uniref:Ribosomal subunit interface protein n=1 Tax=Actinomadura gamaensis TaxID=1763541 RepID=A0ABV9UCM4_9ACTN
MPRQNATPAEPAEPAADDTAASPMAFTLSGRVEEGDVRRAREVFSRVLAHAHEPVLFVRTSLTVAPAHDPSGQAEVSLRADVNGRPIHAHATATSLHEAIAITADRLAARLAHTSRDWESRRGGHAHPSP